MIRKTELLPKRKVFVPSSIFVGNRRLGKRSETERVLNVDSRGHLLQLAICDISLSTRQVSHFPTRLAALGPMRLLSGPGLYPHRPSHNVEAGMVHGGNGEREV